MENTILKHLTITGFVKGEELTTFEILEKNLDNANEKMQVAEKNLSTARQAMITAIEKSLKRIEIDKKAEQKSRENGEPANSSVFRMDEIKSKYEQTIADLEVMKNELSNKIEGYKSNGTEKWDTFKHKLKHDVEELGKALKGFTQPVR